LLATKKNRGMTTDQLIESLPIHSNTLLVLVRVLNGMQGSGKVTFFTRSKANPDPNQASTGEEELVYKLTSIADQRSAAVGLSPEETFVYKQIIDSSNIGIWTKDIKMKSGLPSQTLTKIYKTLESRLLIKTVKSVLSKSKKLYIGFNVEPARSLTGGPWYSEDDREFDWEFLREVRRFVVMCIEGSEEGKKVSSGDGGANTIDLSTVNGIAHQLKVVGMSKVELDKEDVYKVVRTLVLDGRLEEIDNIYYNPEHDDDLDDEHDFTENDAEIDSDHFNLKRNKKYITAHPLMPYIVQSQTNSDNTNIIRPAVNGIDLKFKYWDVVNEQDFDYRKIAFGEGGVVGVVEEHHHT
jgi:hypothetical protein